MGVVGYECPENNCLTYLTNIRSRANTPGTIFIGAPMMYEVTEPDTFDLLQRIVNETKCKPNWRFELVNDGGARRLHIILDTVDNYDTTRRKRISHIHPVPIATYNEKAWRRWIFDHCIAMMNHEVGESLRFGPDEVRPFAPMHGPGENPYTVHEIRSETDALTTQNGSLRDGPV